MKKPFMVINPSEKELKQQFTEFNRIIGQSRLLSIPRKLIKMIVDNNLKYGLYATAMSTYELGRIVGIRQERKRRQRGSK